MAFELFLLTCVLRLEQGALSLNDQNFWFLRLDIFV